MDNYTDQRDRALLDNDRYTFFVLGRIMDGDCPLLLSDHKRLIVCYSGHPYPVWIWTPDDASIAEMEKAFLLAEENGLLDGGYSFNLKYDLAEYFIKRAASDGKKLSIQKNMLAYDCPEPVKPEKTADGGIHRCVPGDLDELTGFIIFFHEELGIDKKDHEEYRTDAREAIDAGNTFFWRNADGEITAFCKYRPNGALASLGPVFTRPEFRRKHYAANLVYQVSLKVKEAGFTPMLYTDADYAASNACYKSVGYIPRGKLCTIG